jgi:hypothetical protein
VLLAFVHVQSKPVLLSIDMCTKPSFLPPSTNSTNSVVPKYNSTLQINKKKTTQHPSATDQN